MKILWIRLKVKNLEEAISFYNGVLGLKVEAKLEDSAVLGKRREIRLELIEDEKFSHISTDNIVMGIEVKNFDSIIKNEEKYNIQVIEDPIVVYEKHRYVDILDPNGYVIRLIEKI